MSNQYAAAAGAKILDAAKPGWFEDIDLGTLDQSSPGSCVLGQTYGTYSEGMRILYGKPYSAGNDWTNYSVANGFSLEDYTDYPDLTKAWKGEIADRQSSGFAISSPGVSVRTIQTREVTLTLTEDEAQVIADTLARVGGTSEFRNRADEIRTRLLSVGIDYRATVEAGYPFKPDRDSILYT